MGKLISYISTITTILTPFLLAAIYYLYNKNLELRKQLASEKREIYKDYLQYTMKILARFRGTEGSKLKEKESRELFEKMMSFAASLMLFGSKKVVLSFNIFRLTTLEHPPDTDKADPYTILKLFGKLILAMRKDLGLSNRGLSWKDMLQTFLTENVEGEIDKIKSKRRNL